MFAVFSCVQIGCSAGEQDDFASEDQNNTAGYGYGKRPPGYGYRR
jgi:hypothetical protein